MCELHKDEIQALLLRTDIVGMHAVGRALVVLYKNQTFDEQSMHSTHHHNGKGFKPAHARMGSSMAEFYLKHNRLSERQLAYWQQPAKTGKHQIRIIQYWRQLMQAAEEKAKLKAEAKAAESGLLSV